MDMPNTGYMIINAKDFSPKLLLFLKKMKKVTITGVIMKMVASGSSALIWNILSICCYARQPVEITPCSTRAFHCATIGDPP